MIGQRVSHYKAVTKIHDSKSGTVHLGRDEEGGREVSIRVLPAGVGVAGKEKVRVVTQLASAGALEQVSSMKGARRLNHRWAPCLTAALVLALAGCGELPSGPAESQRMAVKGITLVDWTASGYATAAALASVDAVAGTGANTLVVVVTAYQAGAGSSEVLVDNARTPTADAVADVIARAKALPVPLRVSLKLHVDLYDGGWRGRISPVNVGAWFASYRSFILPWVSLGESLGVEEFVVGTELAGTIDSEARWRELVAEVRGRFSGDIIYAASWDEAPLVPFWDAVDVVGVNFYGPVSRRDETHRFDVLVEWQWWLGELRLLHKQTGRPILLSEIGYRSIDGAGRYPNDFTVEAPIDLAEQADLYWAALEALGEEPWARGVYWWNWLANGRAEDEIGDYTPEGKPAEQELARAWK